MRRPRAAFILLLLWLAALTFAFHGCPGCGSLLSEPSTVSLARKMLLDVASAGRPQDQQRHHHYHHHHHHQQHHRLHGKWNWQGIPPSAAEDGDPRYGAEKRLVPTGPNPLHH
ncbi:unnamed protein product [Alopecurus aequalis]